MNSRGRCSASVRMTRAEYRYVEEIPGMEMWWTLEATVPTDKYTVTCEYPAGHEGDEHAALVGVFNMDTDKEPYLYWQPGVPGAREIRQPGQCGRLDGDDVYSDVFCVFPACHPGDCEPNQ